MIDSANFNIPNVLINDIPFFYTKFKKFKEGAYHYEYKECKFEYYIFSCSLNVKTKVPNILETINPQLKDKDRFIEKLKSIIEEVITLKMYDLILCRIDYCVDLKLSNDKEVKDILHLLHKHNSRYKYMKQKKFYETSIHLNTKYGSYNINFYDKFRHLMEVEGIIDERFKNVIRFELQVKSRKLKILEKEQHIKRDIEIYFSKSLMEQLYFETLKNYFYEGDYFNLSTGIDIIKKSEYSQTMKLNIIKFLKVVNLVGMTYITKQFCYGTVKKCIELLNELGVNPICLSNNSRFSKMENLLKQLRKVAEEKYFK